MRRSFMAKPFYVSYENFSPELENIVENAIGMFEIIGEVKIPRKHIKSNYWFNGDFGSLDWYINKAYDKERNQARTDILWNLFDTEPFQDEEEHHELVILNSDLFNLRTNFIYGETRPKVSNDGIIFGDFSDDGKKRFVSGSIQSDYRMRQYGSKWEEAFFSILVHEIGHFYGLAATNSPNYISENDPRCKGPLDIRHCNDRYCIMEQVNIPGRLDLLKKAEFVIQNNALLFCDDDSSALKKNLKMIYQ